MRAFQKASLAVPTHKFSCTLVASSNAHTNSFGRACSRSCRESSASDARGLKIAVAEVDVAAAKTCFDANFWGCITVIQAVAPIMAKAKR